MNRPATLVMRVLFGLLLLAGMVGAWRGGALAGALQEATPTPTYTCALATPAASPTQSDIDSANMDMGTPSMDMGETMAMDFDQLYIDMMIPHHASIIALSQAALPRLTDERLREIAQNTIDNQSAEIEDLRQLREQFYGSPEPAPMGDPGMMDMMMEAMPDMGSPDEMMQQMDAQGLVDTFCAAENSDLAFIDLTIPHHEMAIAASEVALDKAVLEEIKQIARNVIDAQQAEIDELTEIRAEIAS